MPSTSKAMRKAAAIAEHRPEELYAQNKAMLKMTHRQLHDFASTPEKGLPRHVKQGHHNVRNARGHSEKMKYG